MASAASPGCRPRPAAPPGATPTLCYTPARSASRADHARQRGGAHTRDRSPAGVVPGPRIRSPTTGSRGGRQPNWRSIPVPTVSMRQLLEAGVHFGHQTRRWNPKMKPYIFARAQRHPHHRPGPDRQGPRRGACRVGETVARGEQVLFVGPRSRPRSPSPRRRPGRPSRGSTSAGWAACSRTSSRSRSGSRCIEQLEARQAERRLRADVEEGGGQAPGGADQAHRDARRDPQDEAAARPRLRGRSTSRADRGHRGQQARDPARRDRRHERGPGRADRCHPGQRRRDPGDPAALLARGRRLPSKARASVPRGPRASPSPEVAPRVETESVGGRRRPTRSSRPWPAALP